MGRVEGVGEVVKNLLEILLGRFLRMLSNCYGILKIGVMGGGPHWKDAPPTALALEFHFGFGLAWKTIKFIDDYLHREFPAVTSIKDGVVSVAVNRRRSLTSSFTDHLRIIFKPLHRPELAPTPAPPSPSLASVSLLIFMSVISVGIFSVGCTWFDTKWSQLVNIISFLTCSNYHVTTRFHLDADWWTGEPESSWSAPTISLDV